MKKFHVFIARGQNPQTRIYTQEEIIEMEEIGTYETYTMGFCEVGGYDTIEEAEEAIKEELWQRLPPN